MAITAERFFAAADALPVLPLDTLLAPGGVVVLAPHPDDESLGCGGLLAAVSASRTAAAVIFISDGGASHRNSRRYPRSLLRSLRESEALSALSALGLRPAAAHFLGLEDAAVPSFGAAFDAALSNILDVVQATDSGTLLATWQHDPHCDHLAAHAMAVAAVQRKPGLRHLAYPVWGHTLPPQTRLPVHAPRGARLDIAAQLPAKRRAILMHRSQTTRLIDDDPEGFMLDATMLAHFDRPFEIFLEPSP